MANGVSYLATPYSKFPGGIHKAFTEACWLVARLLEKGVNVYSPIAHTHPVAIHGGLDPMNLSIWLPFDEHMMKLCEALLVAQMPTWEASKGIAHEVAFFEAAGKPIYDLNPATLFMARRG